MEYLFLPLLVLVSAFFSGSETALFSIGKVARNRLQQSDRTIERLVSSMLVSPRKLLVTVLLGNELTNIAISIATASMLSEALHGYGILERALLSASLVLPILLVFGEITPKTLAAQRPEAVARFVARPLLAFGVLTTPIRWTLSHLADVVVKAARRPGDSPEEEDRIAEHEFRTLIDVGTREGVLEAQERTLIHNVLDFDTLTVADVMRPWTEVHAIDERTPVKAAIESVRKHLHSRVPVYRHDTRNVTGILFAKDLLAIHWGVRPAVTLRRLKRDPLFTLARRPADEMLEEFRVRRTHMAIVVDEYGRAIGLCTMENLLEELFGPITDLHPGETSGKGAPR
jgi:putative hemolysin